jgi:hypothetical protein
VSESEQLLQTADRLLKDVVPGTRGLWPRTVAMVVRAALELELGELWSRLQPEVASAPMRAQLLLMPAYVGRAVAQDAVEAWYGLSRGTHHHAYELAPTSAELRDWLETVKRVRVGLSAQLSTEM